MTVNGNAVNLKFYMYTKAIDNSTPTLNSPSLLMYG